MATTKKSPKKQNNKIMAAKKHNSKAPAIVTISVILLGLLFFIYLYRHELVDKVDELTPPAFNYPTEYEEYVVKYSKEYNVDPVLVFSVIKVESNFNAEAVSNVGARGLMQLMEDAFDWIKFRLDDDRDLTFDNMYDPELNIQYGAYYLSYLMEKYDGSIDLSAAAYHCGMNLVDSWLADGTISAENFKVEDIPDENDQTSHYINKINKAYKEYKTILADAGVIK